jgi:hypothetical protein
MCRLRMRPACHILRAFANPMESGLRPKLTLQNCNCKYICSSKTKINGNSFRFHSGLLPLVIISDRFGKPAEEGLDILKLDIVSIVISPCRLCITYLI